MILDMIKQIEILDFVLELSKSGTEVRDQFKRFKKQFKLSRATFFRCRKQLGLWEIHKHKIYYGKKVLNKKCYFCQLFAKEIHHIDENRGNNACGNLVPLCKKCHEKLHRIYANISKSQLIR